MRFVVVDFAASSGGANTILFSFYNYLRECNNEDEWIFLLNDQYFVDTDKIKTIILKKEKQSRLRRLAFDFFYGRKLINSIQADAVFYLQNTLIHGIYVPQVMYMDQSLAFQREKQFSFFKRDERRYAVYQKLIGKLNQYACKHAQYTIVQTEWLKKAIIEQCGICGDRVVKIPPNESMECNKYHAENIDQNTFFYPASSAIYKNHKVIFEALNRMDEKCSVVLTITENEDVPDECKCIGYISQKEVYERMENNVLLFPSYIESFGLPLKEARRIGTIILAANTAFAHEILEGYENAYFFDTFSAIELAALMEKVIRNEIAHARQPVPEEIQECNAWKKVVNVIRSTVK